jgi:dynein light chain 1
MPPIQKMDASLAALTKVRYFLFRDIPCFNLKSLVIGLKSNRENQQFARPSYVQPTVFKYLIYTLEYLKVLSLGRNNIKKIEGLEPVADTLEELWISLNQIERVNGIECCKKLRVLYINNNKIKAWDGLDKLVIFVT